VVVLIVSGTGLPKSTVTRTSFLDEAFSNALEAFGRATEDHDKQITTAANPRYAARVVREDR
jgi:hypothetical protein